MRIPFLTVTASVSCLLCLALPAIAVELDSEDDKIVYAMGAAIGRNLEGFHLSEREVALFKTGLDERLAEKEPPVDLATFAAMAGALRTRRLAVIAEKETEAAAKFVAEAAAQEGAVQNAGGMVYLETKSGEGAEPSETDRVKVHYHGTLRDGTVFDSSRDRGEPAVFPLNRVIRCWTQALQKMKVGGTATIWCPSELAYGVHGQPEGGIPPGSALRFEVELLGIESVPAG